MRISSRLATVSESTTMAIAARAVELRAGGRDVISLSAGEPDFATPECVAAEGVAAIHAGETRYTAAAGTPELRGELAAALARDFGFDYSAREVCLSAGAKPAIHLTLRALLEPEESVVVLAPYWVSYPAMIELAGGRPRYVACRESNGFLPDFDELENALAAPSVRGILLNSPSNPTGAVWPRGHVEALVDLCRRHDRWILSDEVYAEIHYTDRPVASPAAVPGGRERTVVCSGFSKAFAMTGWRLGWVAGPEDVVTAVGRLQSQVIGNPCSISQAAGRAALRAEARPAVRAMTRAFRERRDFVVRALGAMPDMTLHRPDGAFYAFPGVRDLLARRGGDDVDLCRSLLDEAGVAIVPGSAFGQPGHVRLSFAASLDDLRKAMARLQEWIA